MYAWTLRPHTGHPVDSRPYTPIQHNIYTYVSKNARNAGGGSSSCGPSTAAGMLTWNHVRYTRNYIYYYYYCATYGLPLSGSLSISTLFILLPPSLFFHSTRMCYTWCTQRISGFQPVVHESNLDVSRLCLKKIKWNLCLIFRWFGKELHAPRTRWSVPPPFATHLRISLCESDFSVRVKPSKPCVSTLNIGNGLVKNNDVSCLKINYRFHKKKTKFYYTIYTTSV